ncbi:O-methyltransferase-domain-containing protein [Aspergillus avenaceus]|uniref:O-methyltransferase-domain-containing protein n=1 Tax=Aspergillus avenaceus TaxID=36643 RepID=A0A5N6TZL0_ASPAV|nr:O-methyltransferase-domain-containing protein [Aspergillus avenaceus]
MLGQGRHILEKETQLTDRITFVRHNFFEAQPQRNAAAFFIRQCTHNWVDEDVVKIFKGFIPGLEGSAPGTPLLINDTILPEPGSRPAHEERSLRQMDMLMLVGLGAKQRTRQELERLLKAADERYEIHHVHAEGTMGLLEVHLRQ